MRAWFAFLDPRNKKNIPSTLLFSKNHSSPYNILSKINYTINSSTYLQLTLLETSSISTRYQNFYKRRDEAWWRKERERRDGSWWKIDAEICAVKGAWEGWEWEACQDRGSRQGKNARTLFYRRLPTRWSSRFRFLLEQTIVSLC